MMYMLKFLLILMENRATIASSSHNVLKGLSWHPLLWFLLYNPLSPFTVYVFIGQEKNLVEMMGTMQSLQLFQNGEYLVIFVDMMTYSYREAFQYLWRK